MPAHVFKIDAHCDTIESFGLPSLEAGMQPVKCRAYAMNETIANLKAKGWTFDNTTPYIEEATVRCPKHSQEVEVSRARQS